MVEMKWIQAFRQRVRKWYRLKILKKAYIGIQTNDGSWMDISRDVKKMDFEGSQAELTIGSREIGSRDATEG